METRRKLNKLKLSSENLDSPMKSNLSNPNIWKEHRYRTPKHKKEKADLKNMEFQSVKKFSKSPKIVLKLSKTEELNLLGLNRFRKSKSLSPLHKEKSAVSRYRVNKTISPSKKKISKVPRYYKNKTMSPSNKRKSTNLNNSDIAGFVRENTIKDSLLLKNPVVVLQRLPHMIPHTMQKISNDIINNSWQILGSRSTRSSSNNTSNCKRNNLNASNTRKEIALAMNDEQEDGINKNRTYELIEPETPNLRKILRDRRNTKREEANLNEKVRNTSVRGSMNYTPKPVVPSTLEMKELAKKSNHVMVVLNRINNINGTESPLKKKSVAVTNKNVPVVKSLIPTARLHNDSRIKRTLFTPTSKNLGLKTSATKKVPRFAEIHKKLFAELESAVDAQQRLKERHRALTTPKARKLPISNISSRNDFLNSLKSRIPCKVRLKDATNCIQKKESRTEVISKRQRQNREIIKGVRTNRRFELQMKHRNIKD